MKKRTKATTTRTRELAADELPDELEDDPFKTVLAEFSVDEGIQLQIYRRDAMTGKPRYVKAVPLVREMHGLDWLQRMFGAGDYLLRFYDSAGNSKNLQVSIDDDPTTKKREPEGQGSNLGRDELVSILREQNLVLLKAALERKPETSSSSSGENPVTMKVLEALLPRALERPDISGSLLGMLEKGIELAADVKSEDGGMLGLVRTLAKELSPAVQQFAGEFARERARMASSPSPRPIVTHPPAPAPPGIAVPPATPTTLLPAPPSNGAPHPASSAPSSPPTPEEAGKAMVEGTVRFGAEIVEQAWKGKESPRAVADYVLGEIPPNYYEHLAELTVDRAIALNASYGRIDRPWLEELVSHLRDEATAGNEEGDAEAEERS